MFSTYGRRAGDIGRKNVDAVKKLLQKEQIELVAADTGGDYGRSVELHTETGEVIVRSALRGERKL